MRWAATTADAAARMHSQLLPAKPDSMIMNTWARKSAPVSLNTLAVSAGRRACGQAGRHTHRQEGSLVGITCCMANSRARK